MVSRARRQRLRQRRQQGTADKDSTSRFFRARDATVLKIQFILAG